MYQPADVAHIRADLAEWYGTDVAFHAWRTFGSRSTWSGEEGPRLTKAEDADPLREAEHQRIIDGELFFVSDDMLSLARQAAKTLPNYELQPEDLPSPAGVMLFDGSLDADGQTHPRTLVTWGPSVWFDEKTPAVWLSVYVDFGPPRQSVLETRFFYDAEFLWTFGPLGLDPVPLEGGGAIIPETALVRQWPAIVKTTWTLMQQPLVDIATPTVPRSERKRLDRRGESSDGIRVVQLRRARSDGKPGGADSPYHHQWLVRGHWRQQWYSSRNVHRPVWVAPHVKGPEGAPMLGGERVHAWTR